MHEGQQKLQNARKATACHLLDVPTSLADDDCSTDLCSPTNQRLISSDRTPALSRSNSITSLARDTVNLLKRPQKDCKGQPRPGAETELEDLDPEGRPSFTSRTSLYSLSPRPLINMVKNEWHGHLGHDKAKSVPLDRSQSQTRKLLPVYVLLLCICWLGWKYYLHPAWERQSMMSESVEILRNGNSPFGSNMTPVFRDMVHIKTLDKSLLPTTQPSQSSKRLVIVGDVHGCKDALLSLLSSISFDASHDHLILAGDFVSKGPDSADVVDLAMDLQASCVRGNHEDRILLAWRDLHSEYLPLQGPDEDLRSHGEDMMDEESFSHGDYRDRAQARALGARRIEWMKQCPVILRVGDVEGMGQVVVVHAGLVPGVRLEAQDPLAVMTMRSIDLKTHVPSEKKSDWKAKGRVQWFKLWNMYQRALPESERSTVVYGHDSKLGLQIWSYSKGLDTGCVKGGKLTALVIEPGWKAVKQRVVGVKCRGYGKDNA